MTEWIVLETLQEHLLIYWMGSFAALGLFLSIIFLLILVGRGVEFRYAFISSLPVFFAFGSAGWIQNYIYVLILLGVAIIYAVAMTKLVWR